MKPGKLLARLNRGGWTKLAASVRTGEIPVNVAAAVAYFRNTPFEQVLKLLPKLTIAQRQHLKDQL